MAGCTGGLLDPGFMNRNDKVLCSIERSTRILELGPW
jgi:hypothetical protein